MSARTPPGLIQGRQGANLLSANSLPEENAGAGVHPTSPGHTFFVTPPQVVDASWRGAGGPLNWRMIATWELALLFATGLGAGFVDSVAGGGGLITLPVLLSVCPDPRVALGTNKLQASFGSGSATFHFARAGALTWRDCGRGCLLAFAGSLAGSLLVQGLDPAWLKKLIPAVLLVVAGYVALKPKLGERDIHPRISPLQFDLFWAFGIGMYDGFIGPGTGTFWAMACMLGLGFNLARATAHTKALNFASNVASLTVFLAVGKVLFVAGLTMGAGQWLGAKAGSHMVMTRGTRFIRPVFLTAVILVTVKMIYTAWWPR